MWGIKPPPIIFISEGVYVFSTAPPGVGGGIPETTSSLVFSSLLSIPPRPSSFPQIFCADAQPSWGGPYSAASWPATDFFYALRLKVFHLVGGRLLLRPSCYVPLLTISISHRQKNGYPKNVVGLLLSLKGEF